MDLNLQDNEILSKGSKPFSYSEYIKILENISENVIDYVNAKTADKFIILRHDIEFSISRAYRMALIENNYGVQSTYFFQVISSAYNPFSVQNRNIIKDILKMGHRIGLHFYITHIEKNNWKQFKKELNFQLSLLENGLEIACDRFSYHRPLDWILENRNDELEGLINAYGESFFEYSDNIKNIKYLADSKHRWAYGHPLETFSQNKMQILIHPDEWSENGAFEREFFAELISEKESNFITLLDEETKHFKPYLKIFK